jgi:sugar lactone lactonase YvrE
MQPRVPAGLLAVATLLLATACSPGQRTSDRTATIDTVAGVVHVRNTGDAPAWELKPVATIGAAEGPASFGQVNAVLADADGMIYVADSKAAEIRVFDARGAHVRTLGRRGAGPSEFAMLYSIGWAGDSLAVLDPGNGRIGLMSRTGEWLGQLRHDRISGSGLHMYGIGKALYWMTVLRGEGSAGKSAYARYTNGRLDTLAYPSSPQVKSAVIVCPHPTGGGISFFSNPYAIRPRPVPAPDDRAAVVAGSDYRIALITSAGDTARIIEKRSDGVPISDAEWDEATAEYRDWMAKAPGAKCDPVEYTRPASKPAVRNIFHDDAGRMWVEATSRDGFTFDIFDRDGRQVGSVASPARHRAVPPYIRSDRIYMVTADSLDVQSVRVFIIER